MKGSLPEVHRVLTTIPDLMGLAADSYTTERLGGLTNLVFKINTG